MIRFMHEMEEARRIAVNIEGDVERYAKAFLHIFNNARENPSVFIKVENFYDNRVFVTCYADVQREVTEYLGQFGEILEVEKVNLVCVFPNCETKADFDELFPDDCDTEFFVGDN